MSPQSITYNELTELASLQSLTVVGVACPTLQSHHRERLAQWQNEGLSAELSYMQRSPSLYDSPRELLSDVVSVISCAIHYSAESIPEVPPGYGRIARYAWGRDYHKVLKKRLDALGESLQSRCGDGCNYRVVVDAAPLLERAFGESAGIGFIGNNSLLIQPGRGSFFFLAELLVNISITDYRRIFPLQEYSCKRCTTCIQQCPTGAIVDKGIIDSRRCISYLTIEKRGSFTNEERRMLGHWLFGCDICQEVCPFNHRSLKESTKSELKELNSIYKEKGILSLNEILQIRDHDAFVRIFAGTPLMRTKREGLIRNACAVAANTRCISLVPLLQSLAKDDPSPIIRGEADAALHYLAS